MGGRFAAFALIAALVLAGCTGTPGHPDDPGPTAPATSSPAPTPTPVSDPPDTSSAPTSPAPVVVGTEVPADVPTTGPNLRHKGERPPVMPLLATRHTPAGAVAFAKFFIQTIDWGFATTNSAYMRHYYAPTCIECISHADGLDTTRKAGDRYVGGRFTITRATSSPTTPGAENNTVTVTFGITAVEILNKRNAFVTGEVGHSDEQRTFGLHWRGQRGWIVATMAPPK